jgi:chemotaxis signal transduction protein
VRRTFHSIGWCAARGGNSAPYLSIAWSRSCGCYRSSPFLAPRLITVRTGDRTVAFAAEAVLGIWTIGVETLSQLPPLLRDAATETISAIGTIDAELLFFLRATQIVPEGLFDRLVADGAQL